MAKKSSTLLFILALIIGFILIFTGGVTFGLTTIAGVALILGAFAYKGVNPK